MNQKVFNISLCAYYDIKNNKLDSIKVILKKDYDVQKVILHNNAEKSCHNVNCSIDNGHLYNVQYCIILMVFFESCRIRKVSATYGYVCEWL